MANYVCFYAQCVCVRMCVCVPHNYSTWPRAVRAKLPRHMVWSLFAIVAQISRKAVSCVCAGVLNEGFVAAIIFVAPELLFVVFHYRPRRRCRRRCFRRRHLPRMTLRDSFIKVYVTRNCVVYSCT